jgi:DNA-binding FadR family transcriptional regulator
MCGRRPSSSLSTLTPNHPDSARLPSLRRVRKAYEQVYDQLHETIVSGAVPRGARLPTETALAADLGVGRSTIREALRLLASDGLIETTKGAAGGSFVTLPTPDRVSDDLARNLGLLSLTHDVTLPEFLEARELIETHAVRQVAARRTDADLEALRATLAPIGTEMSDQEQYLHNREFHAILVAASGNVLLRICALPIFYVLHTRLVRTTLPAGFSSRICADHGAILAAVQARDPELAERRMRDHLTDLEAVYAAIWREPSGAPL